jgi:DNA-binding transcriptional regulator GbsR (MarR family)
MVGAVRIHETCQSLEHLLHKRTSRRERKQLPPQTLLDTQNPWYIISSVFFEEIEAMEESGISSAQLAQVLELSGLIGDLMEFWGFRRPLGQIWTWLYFSESPQNATQLQEALGLSAGTISTSLKELRHWGAVRLIPRPGKNADVFTVEQEILTVLLKVLRERELELVSRAVRVLEAATRSKADAVSKNFNNKIEKLLMFARAGHTLLNSLLSLKTPDFEGLRRSLHL